MSALNFNELAAHVGHNIVCVEYRGNKKVHNVALECVDCNEVLLDFDNPELNHIAKHTCEKC